MRLFKGKEGDFTIVRATNEDVAPCADMIAKAMGGQPVNREVLEQTLKAPNVIVLVAKVKERVVGMISGLASSSMVPPPRIDFVGVSDEESARRGLHSRLIDEFIEELRRQLPDAKCVDTSVPSANPQIVAMYSMKDFVVIGFLRSDLPHSDIVLLRKNIRETPAGYTV